MNEAGSVLQYKQLLLKILISLSVVSKKVTIVLRSHGIETLAEALPRQSITFITIRAHH